MSVIVVPRAQGVDLMDALVALAAYVGAKLHLYKNDLTPSSVTVLADLTAADFSGYTPPVVTWSPAFLDVNGIPVSSGGVSLFTKTGATANNIYGCYLTDAAGTLLLWSSRLDDAPFPLAADGDTLPLAVMMSLDNGLITIVPGP